jgi:hypothetical protein
MTDLWVCHGLTENRVAPNLMHERRISHYLSSFQTAKDYIFGLYNVIYPIEFPFNELHIP